MLAWPCVQVADEDKDGLRTATLKVHITPGMVHNVIRNIDEQLIHVDIATSTTFVNFHGRHNHWSGRRKKSEQIMDEGQAKKAAVTAGIELDGFLVHLLDLQQDQVQTERGRDLNSKDVVVKGMKLSKMELLFLLQSKIGEIHGEGFAEKRKHHLKSSVSNAQQDAAVQAHVEQKLKEEREWLKKEEEERMAKKRKVEEIQEKKKLREEAAAKAKVEAEKKKAALAAASSKFMGTDTAKNDESSASVLGGIAQYGSSDSDESSDEGQTLPTAKLK
eukprot:gnl/MRDRNA2_/MRDRNA2_106213_c0_seq1.p1 gnl/MRDRNA2_/MRDRNA2_106213_c0~~gnl/MRDRNA2_/MRDRNA2_106213_c0_seq1.p1  ORF type:complete len:275 (-),score=91.55 gnl/MRDRNA2_/MRDRNA2_106213_c0_seq1:132-956(-)